MSAQWHHTVLSSIIMTDPQRGRPSGAPGQVRTALGMLDRNIVGDTILKGLSASSTVIVPPSRPRWMG